MFLVYLTTDEVFPASLIKLLLIRAGIETNPGPKWTCSTCFKQIFGNQTSVQCSDCKNWIHFKCSGLKKVADRKRCPSWKGVCCTPPAPPPSTPACPHPCPQCPSPPREHESTTATDKTTKPGQLIRTIFYHTSNQH